MLKQELVTYDYISVAEFRALRKKSHVCRDCGKQDAYTLAGRTYCFECAEKDRLKKAEARKDEIRRANMLEQYKKMQNMRRENGQCPICGRPVNDGYVRCAHCRAKARNYLRKYRNNPPRGEYGICWQCNKEPAIAGKRLCQKCYEVKMKCLEKARQANRSKVKSGSETTQRFLQQRKK